MSLRDEIANIVMDFRVNVVRSITLGERHEEYKGDSYWIDAILALKVKTIESFETANGTDIRTVTKTLAELEANDAIL